MYTFGELLKGFRQREGLTQKELANSLGVHRNSISDWERGSYLPGTRDMALDLAEALGLNPTETDQLLYAAQYPLAHDIGEGLEPDLTVFPFGPLPDKESVDIGRSIFVAREDELAQLARYLDNGLEEQRGQVIFVTGEAGSGKTTLVQEFVRRAMQLHTNLIVAGGNCNPFTGISDPYLPFCEILGLLTCDMETRWAAEATIKKHAHRLQSFMPHVLQTLLYAGPDLINTFIPGFTLITRAETFAPDNIRLLPRLKTRVARQVADRDPTDRPQLYFFEQFTRVLRALAHQKPLLLVLDDLQWADKGSIDLLSHLGYELEGCPILIIGIYRRADVALGRNGQRHPLESVVNELQRHFGHIQVDLKQTTSTQFIEAILDTEPNQLSDSFRNALYRHTQGHALFTVEILDSMKKRGDLIRDESGRWVAGPALNWKILPARVDAVIRERIDRLPETLQETLKIASVEGEVFHTKVAASVRVVDEWTIVRQLSGPLTKQHRLVKALGRQPLGEQLLSRYQFRHILFQQYLYNGLDDVEKPILHEKVGFFLEQMYANQTKKVAAELARHFQAAGLVAKAVKYLHQEGERAVRLSAHEEAIVHFKQALALLQDLPDTPQRAQLEFAVQISLGPALIPIKGYAAPEVEQTYARAQELRQQVGDSPQIYKMIFGLWLYYFVREELNKAQELGEQLMQLAQSVQDPIIFMHAYRALGNTLNVKGEFASAQEQFEQGIRLYEAQQYHAPDLLLYGHDPGVICLSYSSLALWYLGYPDQALKRSGQALMLAQKLDHNFNITLAHSFAAMHYHLRRESQTVQDHAQAGLKLSTEEGFTQWVGHNIILQGWALTQQQKREEEIPRMQAALDAWQATGARLARPYFLFLLADSHSIVGQIDEALYLLAEAMIVATNSGDRWSEAELYRLKGELLLKQGEVEIEAETCFNQALNISRRQNAKSLELRAVMSLSRLWQRQGKPNDARQRLAKIYNWFTEGFDTPDLTEARTLLDKLS